MSLNTDLQQIQTDLTKIKSDLDATLEVKCGSPGATLQESVLNVDKINVGAKVEEEKTFEITENGLQNLFSTDGKYITKATINTNVPTPEPPGLEPDRIVDIVENGQTIITPTPDNVAMKQATIKVNVPGTKNTFADLGYDKGDIITLGKTETYQQDIDYGKGILDAWDVNTTSMYYKYENNTDIVYYPCVDMTNVENLQQTFRGCSNLTTVPLLNTVNVKTMFGMFANCTKLTRIPMFNTINVSNTHDMFFSCHNLKYVPKIDTANVTDAGGMFYDCKNLEQIPELNLSNANVLNFFINNCVKIKRLPPINSINCTDFGASFENCPALERIDSISVKSLSRYSFWQNRIAPANLRYFLIKDFGTTSDGNSFDASAIPWGINSPEVPDARQSLIDSLITYSFDRAAAGYDIFTITLSPESKALLTQSEMAAIVAKGYAIA